MALCRLPAWDPGRPAVAGGAAGAALLTGTSCMQPVLAARAGGAQPVRAARAGGAHSA